MPFPGWRSEGLRERSLRKMPVVTSGGDAHCVHAFAAISASGSYFGSALGAA